MPYNIDEDVNVGESGHVAHHEAMAQAINDLDENVVRTAQTITNPTTQSTFAVEIQDDNSSTANWVNRLTYSFKLFGASVAELVTWINEYGEIRGMPAKSNTVAARWFMAKDSTAYTARSATVPTLEVADKRDGVRTTKFGVYKDSTRINGYLVTIGPVVPSSPEAGQIHILTEV